MKIMTKNQYCKKYNEAVDIFNENIERINKEFDAAYPEMKEVWAEPNWTTYCKFISERIDPLIKELNFKTDDYCQIVTIEKVVLI